MQQIIFLNKFPLRLSELLLLPQRVSSMDPSILKLLEEDKDDSIHSEDDVADFQASLNREIEGKNHSSSQQFATGNNGFGNVNILENTTQFKEKQHGSVSGNQNQELTSENESQDHLQPGQLEENIPSHVPQASNLQSRNKSISNEPERPQPQYPKLQKMSSQRDHCVEQPVGPVHHGPEKAKVCELICILVDLVDIDRKMQLRNLYYKFKIKEITAERLIRYARHVVGAKQMRLALSKLKKLEQGNKGTEVPECPNHYRESYTSAEISAQNSDPRGVHVNQLPSTSSGTLSSSATEQGLHNFERPTSVDGLSSAQCGPKFHFQNNSSLPLHSASCQGSVTKDQTAGASSSVGYSKQKSIDQSFDQAQEPCSLGQQGMSNVPMKQSNGNPWRSNVDLGKESSNKMGLSTSTTNASFVSPSMTTQMGSSTMVNFSAPSGTIPAGAKVRKTPKKPSVGRKKPLDALGSSLPPSSKRQKICETSVDGSTEQFNDVTALSGINLVEEVKNLLFSGARKHGHVSVASGRFVHEEEERTVLQKVPLQRKLAEIMAKSGLKHLKDDVERCLSLCVEERIRGLLSNIIRVSKQRTDAKKCRNRTCVTSDIRKQIEEMNQKAKEEWERKHGGEEKLLNEENDNSKEDARSEQVKAKTEEVAKMRAEAANAAARAAAGGDNTFLKWKRMAEARQRPSSGTGRNSKKSYPETGCTRFGKKQGSPKVVRSISVKDVIAVVEKEPQMSRSTLLYRLYNRTCTDVPTQ